MTYVTKPSIMRLARKAGVKSLSEDCYKTVNDTIESTLDDILRISMIVNTERNTKTLMSDDIYTALSLQGFNVTSSLDLGTATCSK